MRQAGERARLAAFSSRYRKGRTMIYSLGPILALRLQAALANATIYPPSMIRSARGSGSLGVDRRGRTENSRISARQRSLSWTLPTSRVTASRGSHGSDTSGSKAGASPNRPGKRAQLHSVGDYHGTLQRYSWSWQPALHGMRFKPRPIAAETSLRAISQKVGTR